uniref:Uncharacterized protein n=1 Tax=Vespula pensylvanica TaxID=30213 RepID=A0A834NF79_VESPE|nr:hypothetical protein H0235_014416 [Vespula pensylvanica]
MSIRDELVQKGADTLSSSGLALPESDENVSKKERRRFLDRIEDEREKDLNNNNNNNNNNNEEEEEEEEEQEEGKKEATIG